MSAPAPTTVSGLVPFRRVAQFNPPGYAGATMVAIQLPFTTTTSRT